MNWGPSTWTHEQKVEIQIQELLAEYMKEKATEEIVAQARGEIDEFIEYLKGEGLKVPGVTVFTSGEALGWAVDWPKGIG